jgi:hypothetical protein
VSTAIQQIGSHNGALLGEIQASIFDHNCRVEHAIHQVTSGLVTCVGASTRTPRAGAGAALVVPAFRRKPMTLRSVDRPHAGTAVAGVERAVLRITETQEATAQGKTVWVLKLEGDVQGQWIKELRRVWRRCGSTGVGVRVLLADVRFVDAAGKVLLTEMHRDGVDIVASDALTAAIRDEIAAADAQRRR